MKGRVSPDFIHEVMFSVRLQNIDELTRILHDVSDPRSENYGNYMTKQEVVNLTSNPAANRKIKEYIEQSGATFTHETDGGDFVFASGPIKIWEEMFNTQFFVFHHMRSEYEEPHEIVRAVEYSIPVVLHEYVSSVFNTVDMPMTHYGPVSVSDSSFKTQSRNVSSLATVQYSGYITPGLLKSFYNVDNSIGSADATQSVYQSNSEYYSPSDLAKFQSVFNLQSGIVYNNANHNSDSQCVTNPSNCLEGSLDIQYIMGMSQTSPTYFSVDGTGSFSAFLAAMSAMTSPPLVISIRSDYFRFCRFCLLSSSLLNKNLCHDFLIVWIHP